MSNDKMKFLKRSVFILDVLLIINAFYLSFYMRNVYFGKEFGYIRHFGNYTWTLAMAVLFTYIFLAFLNSYRNLVHDKGYMAAFRASMAVLLSTILMFAVFFFLGEKSLSRLFFGIFFSLELLIIILQRAVIKVMLFLYMKDEIHTKNVLVIGCGRLGRMFQETTESKLRLGFKIVGYVKIEGQECCIENTAVLGTLNDLETIVKKYRVDEVVVAIATQEYNELKFIIGICDREGLRVKILPAYFEFLQVSIKVEDLFGVPTINVREVPLDSMGNRIVKRAFDIIVASFAILVFSPVMLIVAIGIKITSPGCILFKQERVSAGNRPFTMYKFRSMCMQKKEEEKSQWTTKNDCRVTRFGAFIRKTSLDELPQFFNVLKGDMSIVGPRPERPFWVDKFKEEVPNYMLRHYIKTGITGWAQVNGLRGDTSIEERINCDNYYIRNWSLWMDIKILFLTAYKGFVNKNAY